LVRHLALVIVGAGLTMAGCTGLRADLPGPVAEEPQEPEEPRQAWNPAVIVEPGGRIFVTYLGGPGGDRYALFFNRSLDGGGTWLPKPVELFAPELGTSIGFHQLATDGAGQARVSWLIERKEAGFVRPKQVHSRLSADLGVSWGKTLTWQFDSKTNYPKTVSGSNGALFLLWADSSTPRLVPRFIGSSEGGTAWAGSPVTLPGMEEATGTKKPGSRGREAAWPRLVIDSKDELYAVWQERAREKTTNILFNRSLDGGATWLPTSPRLNTPSPGGHTSREPTIAMDGAGGIYVVWEDSRHNTSDLYFNRSLDGGETWLAQDVQVTAIRPQLASATQPILRADRAGNLYLLWSDLREVQSSLYFTRSLDRGATWIPEATRLDHHSKAAIAWAQTLAHDEAGRVYTAWWEGTGPTEGTLRFKRSTDYGANWEAEQVLDAGLGKEAPRFPVLTVDREGVVYLVWSSARSGNYQLYLNRSTDHGQTWLREPLKLTGRPTRNQRGS
jgi:hypothetical protein